MLGENATFQMNDAVKKNKRKNMPIKKLSMVEMVCFVLFAFPVHKLLQLFYRSTYLL